MIPLRRTKIDWSGCCQIAVQGALWLAKRLSLNLNFFLNRILLLLIQVATQVSSRGWVDPVPDTLRPEKFLGYSRESNPGPLGWQSDVLTTCKQVVLVAQAARRLATVLDGPGSITGVGGGVEIFLHSFVSRLALGCTQPPINEYRIISLGVKAAERSTSHPTSS